MRKRILHWIRLSEKPDPPPGSGSELLEIRASERQLLVDAFRWLGKQLGALAGLLFSLAFFGDQDFLRFGGIDFVRDLFREGVEVGPLTLAGDPMPLLHWLELGALALFALQFLVGGLFLRLAWEVRWYQIGPESLRIREGLLRVRETTLTLENVQNLSIRRGPLQRLLGIADLEVQTAGGGGGKGAEGGTGEDDLHRVRLRGVADVEALRDRIRAARREVREPSTVSAPTAAGSPPVPVRAAAARVLAEARALRRKVEAEATTL